MSENVGFSAVFEVTNRVGERVIIDVDGSRSIAPSRRPDGSLRKEIKIRSGYIREEEVQRYVTKGTEVRQRQEELEKCPVGWCPVTTTPKDCTIKKKKKSQKPGKKAANQPKAESSAAAPSLATADKTSAECEETSQAPAPRPEKKDTRLGNPKESSERKLASIQKKLSEIEHIQKLLQSKDAFVTVQQLQKLDAEEQLRAQLASLKLN